MHKDCGRGRRLAVPATRLAHEIAAC